MTRASFAALLALAFPGAALAQTTAVNAAAFEPSRPLAPGAIVALFGEFPVGDPAIADSLPLPTELAGARVLVDGRPAELYAVFPMQINVRVPSTTEAGREPSRSEITVEVEGSEAGRTHLLIRNLSPAVFTLDAADAYRPGAVLNQDSTVNSPENPARPGEILQIFGMGQGQTELLSPGPPLVWLRTWPSEPLAAVAPEGLPGMWQINAAVPEDSDLPPGPSPLVVTLAGLQSNVVTVWLEP